MQQISIILSHELKTHVLSQTNTHTQKNRIIPTRGNENSTRDLNKLIPLVDGCTTYTKVPIIIMWKQREYSM